MQGLGIHLMSCNADDYLLIEMMTLVLAYDQRPHLCLVETKDSDCLESYSRHLYFYRVGQQLVDCILLAQLCSECLTNSKAAMCQGCCG